MRQIIYDDSERMKCWAAAHYHDAAVEDDSHTLGLEYDNKLICVVLYNGFTRHSCSMHIVTDGLKRWADRRFLAAAFGYPFIQLGLNRVTAFVPAKNTAALMLDMRLGFQPEGRMLEALGGDDLIVLGMLRRHCKWIDERYRHGR